MNREDLWMTEEWNLLWLGSSDDFYVYYLYQFPRWIESMASLSVISSRSL